MRLKRLELFGFKSFADRTQFDFGSNTLTGVVGPNGCGKSNVVDSVRWVLGEQRPTSMRGAEMTDVIFKGSVSRPALSVAEVTLVLDNAGGTLDGRGAEVSITRRVFKDGEGEYLLDGQKVRLKDVREMLFDTGLGSRGYAVLEQGRIDAVLSANPVERRRVFEEAAGISRYRQRKVETELRLKRVGDDMARLEDVIGELTTRVRSLKIQAGKAERFVEAQAQWAAEKTRLLKHRVWLFDRQATELSSAIGALEGDAKRLREDRQTAEASVQTRQREHAALSAEEDRVAADSSRRAGDGRAIDERRAQLLSRVAELEAGADEEGQRASALARTLEERDREIAGLEESISVAQRACEAAKVSAAEHERRASTLEKSHVEMRARVASKNDAVLQLLQQATDAENRARHLSESRGPAAEREQRVAERLAKARAAAEEMEREASAQSERLDLAERSQAEQDALRRDLAQRMQANAAGAADIERRKNALDLERTRVASRIEFLLDRERDLEELSAAGREVLSQVESEQGPCAAGELLGLVADHLRTDSQTARALDATLGARAGALVARDLAIARRVAEWIAARESGQVALVVPAGLAPGAERRDEPSGDRVLGRLRERVRASTGFEPLVDLLCGHVWIARDLESAIELAQRHPGASFVTLEGEFVDAAGLSAGHRTLDQGAVGRRASASDLAAELAELDAELVALDAERRDLVAERASLQKDWERSSQELESRRQARAQAQGALETARARSRDLAAARAALEQESGAALTESGRIEREIAESLARHEALKGRFETENAALTELVAKARGLEAEREDAARETSRVHVESTRLSAELLGSTRRREDLVRARAEAGQELARAQRLSAENRSSAAQGAAECERLAEESARILTERAADEEKLDTLRRAVEAARAAIDLDRQRAEGVTRELESQGETLGAKRLEAQRVEILRAEISRRAEEELSIAASDLTQGFEPEEALLDPARQDELEALVRELRSKLDKLGPVNMEAMAELSEVGGRLEFLTTQHADLARSREALNEAVKTIDKESKRLFLETFEAVRANFQRIFRQLFGGGKADVTLEEGVDVLDAGVEIVARPPGRELLSIGLLSGGQRTLTALALLFAVFEARPSPFCILDEVDAALDDANVERFLAMLDHFRASTQFVVVTHNKGTMAACQSLYGVTMETKGVSRQVAVELSDVDQWAQTSARPPREPAASADESVAAGATSNGAALSAAIDGDSGEPVVELVPASVDAAGQVRGGTARRRSAKRPLASEARVTEHAADGTAAVE